MVGMSVVWMSGRGVESSPQVIGSVPPQTVYVGDSLSIPLHLSNLFTDFLTLQLESCSLASCQLQGGPYSMTMVNTGLSRGVSVEGEYAYVPTPNGLQIVNISDPFFPSIVHALNTGESYGVTVEGEYVYVATGGGLRIVDISDPLSPSIIHTLPTGSSQGVTVEGQYAYVATADNGLQIVDISNPLSPSIVHTLPTGSSQGVAVEGEYAYVATWNNGLQIVDISDPLSPSIAHTLNIGQSRQVTVEGEYAYVATWNNGLQIVDISDPLSPSIAHTLPTGTSYGVAVEGEYVYVATAGGLRIVDTSDPLFPSIIHSLTTGPSSGVVVEGQYIYISTDSGLRIRSERNAVIVAPNTSDRNNYTIQLRGCNLSDDCSDPLEIQVTVPNRDPTVSFDGEVVMTFHVGDSFPHSIYFIDLDADLLNVSISPLPFGWSSFSNTTNQTTNVLIEGTLQLGAQGNWTIEVSGSDEYGGSASLSFRVAVLDRPPQVNEVSGIPIPTEGFPVWGIVLIVLLIGKE